VRLTVQDIANFSKCPRYYHLYKKIFNPQVDIIKKVISKCYIKRTEYVKKAEWRVVTSWVDRIVFKDVNVSDKEEFNVARKLSENIIGFLYKWYHKYYLPDWREGFSNVPLERELGSHAVQGFPLAIILDDEPELWVLDDRDISYLSKDFELKLFSWLLIDAINVDAIILKYMYISPNYGLEVKKLRVTRDNVRNMNQYAWHIAECISRNIDYPSITAMCYTCEVKNRCII
jgi:hypothetical protein